MTSIRKILLVEDDGVLRRACERSLRQRGLEVITASDGETAIQIVEREAPALVLLDLLIPRISGIEVLRRIRSNPDTADIPVVVLSNSSREQDRQDALALGIIGYMIKADLSLEQIGQIAERVVKGASAIAVRGSAPSGGALGAQEGRSR